MSWHVLFGNSLPIPIIFYQILTMKVKMMYEWARIDESLQGYFLPNIWVLFISQLNPY